MDLVLCSLALYLLLPFWGASAAAALLAATAARAALTVGGGLRANRWRAARACHAERVAASEEVCYICFMWYVVCNVYMLAFVMMGAS